MSLVTHADGVLGGLTLVRRDDGVVQLRAGGVLDMEPGDDAGEGLLAVRGLPSLGGGALDVLVGRLGLGGTAARLLEDARVHELVVGAACVRPGGRVLVWSAARAPAPEEALARAVGPVVVEEVRPAPGGRAVTCALLAAELHEANEDGARVARPPPGRGTMTP